MGVLQAFQGGGMWVRRVEHVVLRLASLGFSLVSAHAIRWFFSPLDGVDGLMPYVGWLIAVGFGVLGYFVSRGLAHRIMQRERMWVYAPIVVVVEFVEIFCNYALVAGVIGRATWLQAVPPEQARVLVVLTYLVLSIIPVVSVLLAVVDVDLDVGRRGGSPWVASAKPPPLRTVPAVNYSQGYRGNPGSSSKGAQNSVSPLGVTEGPS